MSGREIELKFEIEEADASRLATLSLLRGVGAASAEQVSTYFDTARARLRKAGLTLRVRRAGDRLVQTVKDEGTPGNPFDRGEWEAEIGTPAPTPDTLRGTPAARLLDKDGMTLQVRPLFAVGVTRTRWDIAEEAGEVELILDQGTIVAGERSEVVREIELELRRGNPAYLFELARAIAAAVPLKIGVLSKSERGFRLIEAKKPTAFKAEPVRLEPGMTAGDAFAAIVWSCIRHFRFNEPLITREAGPEPIHQARVALRRLRSALSLFGPMLDDPETDAIRGELRWAAGLLGQARDLDVLLMRDDLGERREGLEARRAAAIDRVLAALDSSRFRVLMIEIARWLAIGRWRSDTLATAPVTEMAARILDRFRRKLKRAGGGDLIALEDEPRHRARIEAKKLRYGIEFFARLYGDRRGERERKGYLETLEEMQSALGDLNDAATAQAMGEHDAVHSDTDRAALLARAQVAYVRTISARPFWR